MKLNKYLMYYKLCFTAIMALSALNCVDQSAARSQVVDRQTFVAPSPSPAADHVDTYFDMLKGKKIALVVNQTSRVGNTHLVDTLLSRGLSIGKIFSPEHGFRGDADAGAHIADNTDPSTGIPIVSLYGQKRKPDAADLSGIDLLVFDIQDVGARFYTYISTMHYVMEASAEHDIPMVLLDRPNPNGHYVDGPIREEAFKSFVGMHPVPVVYGMTIGEYAQMINGEGWLSNGMECNLTVVPCQDYTHLMMYELPIAPSPNLPNIRSILLYPSLCFFEGTALSIGRGTKKQFQVIGHPSLVSKPYSFTPKSMFGAAKPKLKGELCYGNDLTDETPVSIQSDGQLRLSYLVQYYEDFPKKDEFFKDKWFDKLAGTSTLRQALEAGHSEAEIRATWKEGIVAFKKIRERYLLYP